MKGFEPSTFTLATGRPIAQVPEMTSTYGHVETAPGDSPGNCESIRPLDDYLRGVIEAWPTLSEPVRVAITALVEAARK